MLASNANQFDRAFVPQNIDPTVKFQGTSPQFSPLSPRPIYSWSKPENNFRMTNQFENQTDMYGTTYPENPPLPRVCTPMPVFPVGPNFSAQRLPVYSQRPLINNSACLQTNSDFFDATASHSNKRRTQSKYIRK